MKTREVKKKIHPKYFDAIFIRVKRDKYETFVIEEMEEENE